MSDLRLLAIAAAALVGGSAAATLRLARWRARAQNRRRVRHGFAGQAKAGQLLARAGYAVVDGQPRVAWVTRQDGVARAVELRADYLVERRGVRYVAEVKTGDAADAVANSATRRQLLEYQLAFEVAGVLLVCPDRGAIHHIEFEGLTAASAPRSWAWSLAALGGAAALGWAGAVWLGG
ncbi:MAG: hypothetical protein R3B48_11830 [Kofleriaceae bacterium]